MSIPKTQELIEKFKETVELKNYGSLLECDGFWKRQIILGDIDVEVGEAVEGMIRFWNTQDDENNIPAEEREPIKIYIDSNGGDLIATFTMVDAIRLSKTPVWTINIGSAYSGGFFTFIAGHKRFTYPLASFLYHEGSTGNVGDAGKFQNFAAFYKKQLGNLKDITLKYTNISPELYEEKRRDDWWIDSNEAIELGIADEIVERFI